MKRVKPVEEPFQIGRSLSAVVGEQQRHGQQGKIPNSVHANRQKQQTGRKACLGETAVPFPVPCPGKLCENWEKDAEHTVVNRNISIEEAYRCNAENCGYDVEAPACSAVPLCCLQSIQYDDGEGEGDEDISVYRSRVGVIRRRISMLYYK